MAPRRWRRLGQPAPGKNFKGGYSLWNITNPLKPTRLSEHAGYLTVDGVHDGFRAANSVHSAFAWNAGDRAYLVTTDNDEAIDVDIRDITDPKKPRLVSETNLNPFGVQQPAFGLTDSFLHDMVVKKIGGRFLMLGSYWDGGNVILDVTNPAAPLFLSDTDYPAVDPELLAQTGISLTPEGDAHQGEFTLDNRLAITTDEDFGPYRLQVTTGVGTFRGAPGSQTSAAAAAAISGSTTWVGRACPGDPAVLAAPASGTPQIAIVERGLCTFEEKAQSVLAAGGWEAMLIVNREGADACTGVFGPGLDAAIPTLFVGRDSGFALGDEPGARERLRRLVRPRGGDGQHGSEPCVPLLLQRRHPVDADPVLEPDRPEHVPSRRGRRVSRPRRERLLGGSRRSCAAASPTSPAATWITVSGS